METLTYFIENLFNEELGSECFQKLENKTVTNRNYSEITISGSKINACVFENVIFENCTFWSSSIEDSLFINCLFINCKFQFTEFTGCNFEAVSFDNCIWGLSKLSGLEDTCNSDLVGNKSFESVLPKIGTRTMTLNEILICA